MPVIVHKNTLAHVGTRTMSATTVAQTSTLVIQTTGRSAVGRTRSTSPVCPVLSLFSTKRVLTRPRVECLQRVRWQCSSAAADAERQSWPARFQSTFFALSRLPKLKKAPALRDPVRASGRQRCLLQMLRYELGHLKHIHC